MPPCECLPVQFDTAVCWLGQITHECRVGLEIRAQADFREGESLSVRSS
jgi:hypothetical protein